MTDSRHCIFLAAACAFVLPLQIGASEPSRAQPVPDWSATTTSKLVAALAVRANVLPPVTLANGIAPLPGGRVTAFSSVRLPAAAPAYFAPHYQSALKAPLPAVIFLQSGIPATIPQTEWDLDPAGLTASYQPKGATKTATNAFFQQLGTNGRSCATCHQPQNGMGVSVSDIRIRYLQTLGQDPIFAPVDGANCPSAVARAATSGSLLGNLLGRGAASFQSAHSLLLTRGLIRIFLPVPQAAEFTIQTVTDPNGCNTDPTYDQVINTDGSVSQIISVYRRPLISANLGFVTDTGANHGNLPPIDLVTGQPLTPDPINGGFESGNIMWDGREPTLQSQAIDATLSHAQALTEPTTAQVNQMVAFENGIFTAQTFSAGGGWLQLAGGKGGPLDLSTFPTGNAVSLTTVTDGVPMNLYSVYSASKNSVLTSIARGQHIFDTRTFVVTNVAGFNDAVGNSPTQGPSSAATCGLCHNQINSGADSIAVGQHDIGTGGGSVGFGGPAPDSALPIFRLTCLNATTTPYHGAVVLTNDPGKALITGKCADIGRKTIPQLRALSSRAPYFSDGSASTLLDVVNFYNTRFRMALSARDKADLVNFLAAL